MTKHCAVCGQAFEARIGHAKYCSPACRKTVRNQKESERRRQNGRTSVCTDMKGIWPRRWIFTGLAQHIGHAQHTVCTYKYCRWAKHDGEKLRCLWPRCMRDEKRR